MAGSTARFLCGALPIVAIVAILFRLLRWHARVTVWPDVIAFNVVPWRWGATVIPLVDVTLREAVDGGVRLRAGGIAMVERTQPYVVPADDEATAARLHALLDGPALRGELGTPAGSPTPLPAYLGTIALSASWALAAMAVGELESPALLAVAFAASAVALASGVRAFLARWGRLHVGAATLSLRHHVLPWAEVTSVAVADQRVAIEARDGRRLQAFVGGGPEASAVRDAIERRMGRPPAGELPAWAAHPRRRRRVLLTLGLCALPFAPLGWSLSRREAYTCTDHLGQTLQVIYRRWDGAPDVVVFVADGSAGPAAPADVTSALTTSSTSLPWRWRTPTLVEEAGPVDASGGAVHLRDGPRAPLPRGATVLALSPGAEPVRSSGGRLEDSPHLAALARRDDARLDRLIQRTLAALTETMDAGLDDTMSRTIERCFPGTTDPTLVAIRDGVASRRCLVVVGADAVLAVAIGFGEVESVLVQPPGPPGPGCLACVARREHPGRAARVLATGEVLEAGLPGREAARRAVESVRNRVTVEAALGPLTPGLWGR